jgi:hypothetical protein
MSKISFALAVILVLGLPLSSQSFAAQVTASAEVAGDGLAFEIPTHHLKGTVRPAAGHRLYIVSIVIGEEGLEADVRRVLVVTTAGTYEPIGAGGGALMIIPLDRVPLDQEIGQILPSDAIVALTRRSAESVILEAGPRATLAFLYELPAAATVRALRMPDGRELTVSR